jgi:HEAT repeat protein
VEYWRERLNSTDATASNQANTLLNTEIIPRLTNTLLHDTNDSRLRLALVERLNSLPGMAIYSTTADGRRVGAAAELGDLGSAAKATGPALLEVLNGHDEAVRGAAAVALGKIHYQPERVVPLLIALLDNPDLNDEAADALGEYGPLAKAAVPKLIPMLKAPDKDARHAATVALKKIDSAAAAEAGVK